MTTASLELCKELHELSGWLLTDYEWRYHVPNSMSKLILTEERRADDYRFRSSPEASRFREENKFYPAYDLGYLLRKLQEYANNSHSVSLEWCDANYPDPQEVWLVSMDGNKGEQADTPEDAACKLCIKLFKQGILKK